MRRINSCCVGLFLTYYPGFDTRPWFNIKMRLTSIGNPIVDIRRSYDRLISTMGFPILVRRYLYIESGPRIITNPFSLSYIISLIYICFKIVLSYGSIAGDSWPLILFYIESYPEHMFQHQSVLYPFQINWMNGRPNAKEVFRYIATWHQ